MSANYKSISATNQVKVGLTILKGIFVSAASSTPLITVYDSGTANTGDPTILGVFVPAAAGNYTVYREWHNGKQRTLRCYFGNGSSNIYI
jgi:hypothetical protein